jgi:hypothetical protein
MGRFVSVDRNTDYLLPPSVEEWLPPGRLARFASRHSARSYGHAKTLRDKFVAEVAELMAG